MKRALFFAALPLLLALAAVALDILLHHNDHLAYLDTPLDLVTGAAA